MFGCVVEMKGQKCLHELLHGPGKIFIYCVLDQVVMESGSGDFSGEASARLNHLATVPSHFFHSISLTFSLTLSFI